MKRVKKPVFFIIAALILALTYTSVFGVYTQNGDTKNTWIKGAGDIRWGIDIRGGVEATFSPAEGVEATAEQLEAAKAIIELRMVSKSITDYEIYTDEANDKIIVRFPWKSGESDFDPEKAIEEISATALLTFREGKSYETQTVDGEGKAMHKSLGNGMDPAEIINEFGADMLRLWAGSADYHADMRCSKEIFKQLTQNYLKFRNTARYCLGNLDGFDAGHLVAPEDMLPLDRWAITKLNDLIRRVAKAYDNYEFHVVSHAINDFCVVELSSFYLDIIKDRLYCEERNGLKRRSAQTALFLILDSMTKMFAPILAFTCDEIWLAMPHRAEDDARNVLLNVMNQPFDAYALSNDELAKWDQLIRVRTDVNGVLEAARAEKRIGKPLEAAVTLRADDDAAKAALDDVQSMNLPELLIVSQCLVGGDVPEDAVTGTGTNFPGLHISVRNAPGTKCPRCWMHSEQADPETGLCPRCAAVVAAQKAE